MCGIINNALTTLIANLYEFHPLKILLKKMP